MDFVTLTSDFEEHIGFMVDFTYRVIIVLSLMSREELRASITNMRSARKEIKTMVVFIINLIRVRILNDVVCGHRVADYF